MITLNLIPEQEKKELRIFDIYLMLKNIIYLILFGTIIIAAALLLTKFILQNHFNKIINETYITATLNQFSSNEIKKFNQEFAVVKTVQQNYIAWSNLLLNFGPLVNDGITISKLSVGKEKAKIDLMGTAALRDDLINFKNNLDNSNYFEPLELPLTELLQKENINFKFTLKLTNFDITLE